MNAPQTTSVPLIVKVQVAVALLATIVTIALAWEIPGLLETKEKLNLEITNLEKQKADLEKQTADLEKQRDATKSAYQSLANNAAALNPDQAQKAIEQSVNSNPDAAAILPRIFIHIRMASQRPPAKQVAATLQQQGYIVPGIQILVDKGPEKTQVRYFHTNDRGEAQKIAGLLVGAGAKDAEPVLISGHDDIRARQYEIWFAPTFP